MKRNDANWLGYAEISPSAPVVAGSYGTWTLTYVVGKYGVDDGGRLKVAMRHASDWGVWQMDEPREDNYATATVLTQQSAKVRLEFAPKGYLRPFFKTLVVTVYDGSLSEGDKVVLTFGDTNSGSRGMKAQSFVETRFEFRVAVECFETDVFYEVPGDTCLKVVSAPVARLLALAESRCSVGQTIDVFLKAEDMFGNPAHLEGGEVEILRDEHVMIETRARNHSVRGEVAAYGAQFTRPGVHVLRFSHTPTGLSCNTNPIQVLQSPAEHRLYWGDFHGQSGYSIGTAASTNTFGMQETSRCLISPLTTRTTSRCTPSTGKN